jgi:hypothetical protein
MAAGAAIVTVIHAMVIMAIIATVAYGVVAWFAYGVYAFLGLVTNLFIYVRMMKFRFYQGVSTSRAYGHFYC